ncbi:MAG: hypothetical protein A2845_04020 [Candidatus Lloydbacteria bacterium RIFCSPHIGHO2_01_FULL_49_22]|uniref:Lipoprotein n=1 Tax=Candidatus Lloydbacteria bacterium RIFCSPHIGHO2_01_FULL_49_22 TaxID=1798658 RepID=A0A1G2CZ36_9BACT|nr:MAG: hypothetical protein A2845_04020 [Candidatus Lloydbacteria bacterium RIFCSPHIGHO2_01_FULL_49_22]OGZ09093.1 MAG: hypothetical protein A3C14_03855 [Candidatus Lloydbacteria bacterium RIFCSPHIGHO2_02_FULL_50_18]
MKYLTTALVLTTTLIAAGCTDSGYKSSMEPLPPIGTNGLFPNTILTNTVNANDILSGKDTTPSLCWVTYLTPIVSVHNNKNGTLARAMLEENAKEDQHYLVAHRTDSTKFGLCTKGAIIEMEPRELASSVRVLFAHQEQRAADRAAEKDIRKILEQKK